MSEKEILYDITCVWSLKVGYNWAYLQNRKRLTDIENELMVTKGEKLPYPAQLALKKMRTNWKHFQRQIYITIYRPSLKELRDSLHTEEIWTQNDRTELKKQLWTIKSFNVLINVNEHTLSKAND